MVAPFVVPAGWWLVAANVALDAHDLYEAARAYEAGDLAAAGQYVLVTAAEQYLGSVPFPGGD